MVLLAVVVLAAFPGSRSPLHHLVTPRVRLRHRPPRIQPALRLPGLLSSAMRSSCGRRVRAAVLSSKLGVKSFELVLLIAGAARVIVAIPVALLSVALRAHLLRHPHARLGMLFHSFLFKFYDLTGGDTGIRVLRPSLPAWTSRSSTRPLSLIGPFYYYCLAAPRRAGHREWRLCTRPRAAPRRDPREPAQGGVPRRARALLPLDRVPHLGVLLPVGGVILAIQHGTGRSGARVRTHSGEPCVMTCSAGFAEFLRALVGAFTFIFLKSELRASRQYWRFFLGVLLVLIVVLFPRGLWASRWMPG